MDATGRTGREGAPLITPTCFTRPVRFGVEIYGVIAKPAIDSSRFGVPQLRS